MKTLETIKLNELPEYLKMRNEKFRKANLKESEIKKVKGKYKIIKKIEEG